jgi:hypothetical protein
MTYEQIVDLNIGENVITFTVQKETSVKRWLTEGDPSTLIESKVIEFRCKTITVGSDGKFVVTDNTTPSRATIDPSSGLISY